MRTVLHVLPHPGGGGERYVDLLSRMEDYRFERIYLAPTPSARDAFRELPRSWWSTFRRTDVLHVHGEVAAEICLPALAARRSVVTLHGLHLLRRVTGAKQRAAVLGLRLAVRAADRTICVAEAERADALAALGERAARRLVVIHNGVEVPEAAGAGEKAAARLSLGIDPSAVVGLYVGGLDPHKDVLVAAQALLAAAESRTELRLLVAGDGPQRGELKRIAADGGVLRLLGYRSELRSVLAAADFFVLPSRREGLSMALLEAMAFGLPAVVSDAPGNPEAVGDAGIVVARGDRSAFAEAFVRLADPAERRSFAERSRAHVAEHFTADEMARKTKRLYDELA